MNRPAGKPQAIAAFLEDVLHLHPLQDLAAGPTKQGLEDSLPVPNRWKASVSSFFKAVKTQTSGTPDKSKVLHLSRPPDPLMHSTQHCTCTTKLADRMRLWPLSPISENHVGIRCNALPVELWPSFLYSCGSATSPSCRQRWTAADVQRSVLTNSISPQWFETKPRRPQFAGNVS